MRPLLCFTGLSDVLREEEDLSQESQEPNRQADITPTQPDRSTREHKWLSLSLSNFDAPSLGWRELCLFNIPSESSTYLIVNGEVPNEMLA